MKRALLLTLILATSSWGAGPSELGKSFTYDLSKYKTTDPALIRYEEGPAIPLTEPLPTVFAVTPEGSFVLGGKGWIRTVSSQGIETRSFIVAGPVTALHVDSAGRLFAGLETRVRIWSDETTTDLPDLGERAYITSIATATNRILVADAGQRLIWTFDENGRLRGNIGSRTNQRFIIPSPYFDIGMDPLGRLWSTNPGQLRIQRHNEEGHPVETFGKASMKIEGFSGCCNPVHLAIAPDGRFVTSEKGIPRIKVYQADGTFDGVVAGAEQFNDGQTLDIVIDGKGTIFVLDLHKKVIRTFKRIAP